MANKFFLKNGKQAPLLLFSTILALIIASFPISVPAFAEWEHDMVITSLEYKKKFGSWEVIDIPEAFKTNSIHAATLPTGKVLLVAGSGNDEDTFNAFNDEGKIEVLETAIYDPATGKIKKIKTPSDLFCSGHALLQTGNLLVAGGTSGYELLEGKVKKPAGAMAIYNENPDDNKRVFEKGTHFVSPTGKMYASTQEVTLEPATKMNHGEEVMVHRSSTKVFVEAVEEDNAYITSKLEQYSIEGLTGIDAQNIYGQGGPFTLDKQDFRGDDNAYEFDFIKEEYVKVEDMKDSRWYASLPVLSSGEVLAVSGLDSVGQVAETTEIYNPVTKQWSWGPNRQFPTYPALFRTANPDVLFFSGSSAGYGPADKGREPGFWNIKTNNFQAVDGLREADILETSASVILPPKKGSNDGSQNSQIMVAGGGGVGESKLSTARTDIIDLGAENPSFTPGPDLPAQLRYLNLTVTPWDEVFATGGSTDYRAKSSSYSYKSFSIDPTSKTVKPMADELVGRTYHSGSLLLRDGRVLVFGGDPLFGDKDNTAEGEFEKRLEIYTPPQYYRNTQHTLKGPDMIQVKRGTTLSYTSSVANTFNTARLIPPSSTTHVTNIEQRSIGVVVSNDGKQNVTVIIPDDKNYLPNGWYMLFVVNSDGMPSVSKMIQIIDS
ncbi:MAG: galactose oxidase early set domain-containing protein [Patescibacteria group bacterium]